MFCDTEEKVCSIQTSNYLFAFKIKEGSSQSVNVLNCNYLLHWQPDLCEQIIADVLIEQKISNSFAPK